MAEARQGGRLAQLVERFLYTEDVGGSSPSAPTRVVPAKAGTPERERRCVSLTLRRPSLGCGDGILQAPHQLRRHRDPKRICDDRLAAAAAQGEEVKLAFLAADQPPEQEAAGRAGDEDVAVECLAESLR